MLLAIDVGNTNIHFGLHDGNDWLTTWRARTVAQKMGDEYAVLLHNFMEMDGFDFSVIDAVVMASVVPDLTQSLIEMSRRQLGRDPLNIEPGTKTGIKVLTDNPREVGPDRVVNTAAVRALYGAPAIVIDFGTATTWDILNAEGNYIGGIIAPGIGLAHDALVSHAARLVKVDIAPPPAVIGRNTVHAMQSGLFHGYVSLIEGLVTRIRDELKAPQAQVIATGGLAPLFAEHTRAIDLIAPNLTLDGLRIIWEMNEQK